MKDDSVVDFIDNLNKLKENKDLKNHAVITKLEDKEINLLTSSKLFIEEHALADVVEELELNLSYFLFDDFSTIIQTMKNKLSIMNINIVRLNSKEYYLDFGDFCILFDV